MYLPIKDDKGFTLIETLVSVAVVMMVMTALISGVSFSVKNSRESQEQSATVRYGQEAIEWIRAQRDIDGWGVFYESVGGGGSRSFCLASLPSDTSGLAALEHACGEEEVVGSSNFTRTMYVNAATDDDVRVTVELTWVEGGVNKSTTLSTRLRKWER